MNEVTRDANERTAALVDAPEAEDAAEPTGLLLHGIVSARRHERALAKLTVAGDERLIEHEGLAALVHSVPYRVPDWDAERIREHSRTVERAMRRLTIVPAPYGIVFEGPEQVIGFLDDQHIALDEALSFLDGAFEMRLHIQPSGQRAGGTEGDRADQVAEFYTALRRRSRAAMPLATDRDRLMSAAFLVDRAGWVSFVEYADALDSDHPEYRFDLTGPWPAYDFVQIAFLPRERDED